jgi:hypothetical protein
MTTETRSVAYYSQQLQRCAAELNGLGHNLSRYDAQSRMAGCSATAADFHNTAGTVARLRSQLEHLLDRTQALLYACEDMTNEDGV